MNWPSSCPRSSASRLAARLVGAALSLARGQALGLVGESACGKSSLGRALAGLEPAGGQILLHGRPLPGRPRDQARRIQAAG